MSITPLSVRVCTFCTQSPMPSQAARLRTDNQVADVSVDETVEEEVTSENLAIDDEGDIEAYEEESSDTDDSDANESEETEIVCAGINYRRCPYFSTT